ncbi:MAG: hypothetical protein LIO59_00920, partial [Oscillospiraceae bacterium]|nr:hypothetical protein [Oscillospiraceae bacterium]
MQLTVQSNKFALDNEAWILQTDGQYLDLANKEDSTVTRYIARVGDTLYKKLIDAVNAADSGDTVYIINNYTLEKTIEIDKDITIMSETNATKNASNVSDGSFKDSSNKTLSDFTYYPEGDYTLTLISGFADTEGNTSGFIVKDGATLNIGDPSVTESTVSTTNGGYLALDGNRAYATDGAMVSVEDGTLYINAGVTAENNNDTSGNGYGGAIYVASGAEAVLNGGALYANRANYGGAVYADGTFRMISGVINEHTNGDSDGAIYVSSNGRAVLTGGEIKQNGSYAVYQNGTLEMGGGIFIDSANAIYLPEGKIITVIEALDGENDTDNPISLYVEEEGADGIDVIETSIQGDVDSDKTEAEYILLDKRFAVTDGRKLSRSAESGKENYIVIKEINVTYDANGGTGSVPEDTEAYDGGDLIDIKPVTDDLARPGMMFIGWSTQKIDSVRSFTEEGSVQIYYNTEYSDDIYSAISYSDILYAYSDVTLYAVWALDTNINDIPDYRENVFNITVNTAEHGSMSASADTLQAGDMLLLTANPDTGYVMSDVTVEFYIDGEQNIWTLSSGDIQQISDTYLWLNMPKADIT